MRTDTSIFLTGFGAFLFAVCCLYISLLRRFKNRPLLPPGPRGYPIIGDLFNAISYAGEASVPLWERYLDMGQKYNSDVIHIDVLGDHTIILNSARATTELLEKRSGLYSDRPGMYMMTDLVGWHWDFSNFTEELFIKISSLEQYRPIIHSFSNQPRVRRAQFIVNFLITNFYFPWYESHAGSIILRLVYGMTTQSELNTFVELASLATESAIATMNHGSFIVDYFPLLKYVPGASFKRKANVWAPAVAEVINAPWEKLKASVASGTALSCFATKNLEKFNLMTIFDTDLVETDEVDLDMEKVIKNCAGIAYFAGLDTTKALIMTSILAISHHPEVLAKAQKELDAVVGPSRLPNFSDRTNLPYVEAFIREVERMYPITPLAVAHRVMADDIYEGYFIPKDATVVGNAWAILHSEELYKDPLKFNPDRFIQDDKDSSVPPNPELYAFGFGRRICPGRYLALESTWILIACLLATCDITRPLEEDVRELDPVLDFVDGMTVHPKPYDCRIVPRSAAALNLMKTGYSAEIHKCASKHRVLLNERETYENVNSGKRKGCIKGESNPRRVEGPTGYGPHGNDPGYHYPIDATSNQSLKLY
ncbi:cytochrome P450 [Dendrothele bispora CBS 962.96]|uniref:Cytochrome P450 n=1 Tax=Dendrothele bispora (strain CBS 962.96) TaxID=1314807 RepID=A0A4V4HB61_DENBC|nr:cytochrome P450 [Dendrothele bispora CBS 962.96]